MISLLNYFSLSFQKIYWNVAKEISLMKFINGYLRKIFIGYNKETKAFSRNLKTKEDSVVIFVNRYLWDRKYKKVY